MDTRGPSFQMVMPWTGAVRWLVIANVAVWFGLQIVLEKLILRDSSLTLYFGLIPLVVVEKLFIWQPFTYMFLHATDNITHILFNMLMLWMTGSELEARWGARFFTLYYFVCGAGAAILYVIILMGYGLATGQTTGWLSPVVGASGAVFGLLLAYGILFGERVVYFMMIFPMKARYFVMILGAILVVNLINDGLAGGNVSHLAHLGGIASGFIFLKLWTWLQQRQWRGRRGGRKLKLVINNDPTAAGKGRVDPSKGPGEDGRDDGGGPRYWN